MPETSESKSNLEQQLDRLDSSIEALKKHLPKTPRAHKRKAELPPMRCPHCGCEMESGRIQLHGDLGTFLVFGFGLEHAYFQPGMGSKEEKILHSTKIRQAYRCEKCKTVVIPGTDPVT